VKRILVTCSSRVPPNHATASGMTKSAFELVQGLARAYRGSGAAITVLVHPATRLPTGVQWLAPDPSLDRCGEGFGGEVPPSVERAIADQHVILDQSESPAISIAAARAGTPCIRTIRLAVNGSSNMRAAKHVTLAVHLSEDHRARDHYHPVCRTTVIRDAIPVRAAPACDSKRLRRAISIGRIESDKGHDIAAEVARSLGLPLLAVGPVVDPGYLAQLAGMRGVRVLSPNHRGRALSLLRRSELLIWTPRVIEPGGRGRHRGTASWRARPRQALRSPGRPR
jgi:hypothetical protein